jgi:hypothetical protein
MAIDLKKNIAATPRAPGYQVGQYVPLDQIRMDGGTQARAGLDNATLSEYAESWLTLSSKQNGFLDMPLIIVYHDGTDYWLADGFHRVVAYRQFLDGGSASASPRAIRAEVRMGTKRDAVLYACGANATHGLKRTQADKRRAIETLLNDPEWRQWSDSEIGRRCNVDHKTVGSMRADLYPGNSQDSRTVERNGTTYQQKPPARPAEPTATEPAIPIPPDDLRKAGVGLTRHGSWWIAVGYSGEMNNWTSGTAQPWDLAVAAAREEIAKRTKPPAEESFWAMTTENGQRHYWERNGANTAYVTPCGRLSKDMPPFRIGTRDCSACIAATNESLSTEAPDLPIDFSIVQRRLASHGVTLAYKDGMFVTHTEGKSVGIATPTWSNVTDRLEYKEAHPDPAHVERIEEQIEAGDQEPQLAPTLIELDANRMPDDLHRAGYYWHSATPPTIALNGSDRRWDAPTIEQAIAGARAHFDAKGEPIAIFPALTPLECKALIREAKLFIESGADRKLPTIGKILRIAARMALEATE